MAKSDEYKGTGWDKVDLSANRLEAITLTNSTGDRIEVTAESGLFSLTDFTIETGKDKTLDVLADAKAKVFLVTVVDKHAKVPKEGHSPHFKHKPGHPDGDTIKINVNV